jgi:hypothetical protein
MRIDRFTQSALVLLICSSCAQNTTMSPDDIQNSPPQSTANGSVNLHGDSWFVKDVVAFKDKDTVLIAFADSPYNRNEFALDGRLDSFDILEHKGQKITLSIDTTGPSSCLDFSNNSGGGSMCNSDIQKSIQLTHRTKDHISGTMHWGEEKAEHIYISFDAPIQSKLARIGEALPEDGGEPGKAVQAHFSALQSGDFEQMKAQASPKQLAQMKATSPSDVKEMLKMLQLMSPTKIKITGGVMNGDSAIVDFIGENHGETIQGIAQLTRINGHWYLDKTSESTRSGK